MPLTLQRKLELAGALSKVQPELQRLHLMKKPKRRHVLRNVLIVGGAIAVGMAVALAAYQRHGCRGGAVAERPEDTQQRSPEPDAPGTETDREGVPDTGAREPHDIAASGPA